MGKSVFSNTTGSMRLMREALKIFLEKDKVIENFIIP